MDVRANCKKMADLIKKGNYKKVGDFIDPVFKEGLKQFGIYLNTQKGDYTLEKITKIKFRYYVKDQFRTRT